MILFDTETTGLIKNIAVPLKDQPRIVELFAIKFIDEEVRSLKSMTDEDRLPKIKDMVASAPEWHSYFHVKKMDDDAIKTHGLTLDFLRDKPPFEARALDLSQFFLGERIMIAHNLAFDRDQLMMELRRCARECKFPWPPVHICSVEATEGWEGFRLGLTMLHEKLFGEGFPEAHRADADTRAMARCVLELIARGIIRI